MNPFYTYAYTRNNTHAVFYVGKGRDNRAWCKRRIVHWNNIAAKHGYTAHILDEFDSEQDAFAHERYLITSFKAIGASLCNVTDGGDGTAGWHHLSSTKLKIKLSNTGKIRPPVTAAYRAKQSRIAMGRIKSPETCAKLSMGMKGKKHSPETLALMRAKAHEREARKLKA